MYYLFDIPVTEFRFKGSYINVLKVLGENIRFDISGYFIITSSIQSRSLIMNIRFYELTPWSLFSTLHRICIKSSSLNMKSLYCEQICISIKILKFTTILV